MAEEKSSSPAPASSGPSKAPLLLALVNTLAVLGAGGMLYYTKFAYKRPVITEESERKRLETLHDKPPLELEPGNIVFEPFTANIEPGSNQPKAAQGSGAENQLHYANMSFTLEIRDAAQKPLIDELRPVIMDQILAMMAHKLFHELTTVQGRYLLRTQIIDLVNRLAAELPSYPSEPKAKSAKAEGGHGGGGGEHGAAPAEGGHGGGGEGGEHGGGHGEGETKAPKRPSGPPINQVFRDGLVSNVFFTRFIVQ